MIFAVKCRALILVNFRNCVSLSDPNVVQHFHLISFETIHSHCVGLPSAPSEVPSVYSHIDIHIKSNICNCIFPPFQGKWRLSVNTPYPGGISKTVTTDVCARHRNFVSWFRECASYNIWQSLAVTESKFINWILVLDGWIPCKRIFSVCIAKLRCGALFFIVVPTRLFATTQKLQKSWQNDKLGIDIDESPRNKCLFLSLLPVYHWNNLAQEPAMIQIERISFS